MMLKAELSVRFLIYFTWTVFYTVLAAWVGEGQYHENGARFAAVLGYFFASVFVAMPIEFSDLPKTIVKAWLEDSK